ncbi:hypothetical protein [Streptomyces parvulus]|uniref:hypothetical protein n=1 Tax=Streptomyces parvulus TaxID=146923 RepID=UPI0037FF01FC
MKPSWENIERVLAGGRVSDAELAYRLGCKRDLVARVRASLGQPPMPLPPVDALTPELRVMISAALTSGGHRYWTGRCSSDGVPILDAHTTVGRVAFRLAHGREPEGIVRVGCTKKHCCEGSHLTDKVIRDARAGAA